MKATLSSRVLTAPAALSLLLLLTAVGAAWYVRQMQRRASEILTNNVASVRAAQELETSIREIDTHLDRYLITNDRAHLTAIALLRQRATDALAIAEALAYTPEEQVLMARVRTGCERLFAGYDRVTRAETPPDARREVAAVSGIPEKEILGPAHEYLILNEAMLTSSGLANESLADSLAVGLLALGVCGAGGGLVGGWVIATGVGRKMRQTEERLFRSERDALRSEQLAWVGQMAAGVAHEVRNPLMAIKILVQSAAEADRGAAFRAKDLAVIQQEIGRLEQIVAGFLDFARPPRPDKHPVDLGVLVEQAAAGVRPRADKQRVAVAVESPRAPVVVHADPNQLRQVVYNLLFNALDAQPRGGRVAVSFDPPDAGGVALRVEDEGGGIPHGLGDRMFDPFVSTKPTGMGLGLSICRRIVESHGGTIRAANRTTGGAAFVVTLPTEQPDATPAATH